MNLENLPVEWCETDWVSITNIQDGFKRGPFGGSLKKESFVETGYAIYEQYAPINDDCTRFRYFIDENKYQELEKFSVEENDFLISCSGTMGRITQVPVGAPKGLINQALLRIRLIKKAVDPKYFLYLFKSPEFQNEILSGAVGGAIVNLASVQDLKKIKIPLPNLAEQEEIVRQLDVILAQVEQIKARLDAIPAILKKFRQSVLADAVSGKSMGDSNYKDWIQSTIGKEFKCIDGDRGKNYPKKEDYKNEGYCLFLSTKNVRKFGFLFDEKVFISKEKHGQLRNGTLQRDDLIITTRGTLGHIASYNETVPFDVIRINSGMLILRKINDRLLNEFVMLYLASPIFQRIIEEQRTGSAQPQLPAKILKDFEIRVPTIEQQYQIVERVNRQFSLIKWVENAVQSAQKRVNLLTQSILAKAFSGELTAEWRTQHQDLITGVNSAEALLAKIQSEREASKPVKNTRKKKEV